MGMRQIKIDGKKWNKTENGIRKWDKSRWE